MLIDKVEKGKVYNIEWIDGHIVENCIYVQKHRGFFIFIDKNSMKIICRPESIKAVSEVL
tara:strand:- start:752 stop:931 length:180 start_codon:yes stop_codon:yes gene_type:complete